MSTFGFTGDMNTGLLLSLPRHLLNIDIKYQHFSGRKMLTYYIFLFSLNINCQHFFIPGNQPENIVYV